MLMTGLARRFFRRNSFYERAGGTCNAVIDKDPINPSQATVKRRRIAFLGINIDLVLNSKNRDVVGQFFKIILS